MYRRFGEAVNSAFVATATALLLPVLDDEVDNVDDDVVGGDSDVDVDVDVEDDDDAIAFERCLRHVAICASRTRTYSN